MPFPNTRELEGAIVDILKRAEQDGQLSDLTPRIVRQALEERFSLEEGALEPKKHKAFIRDTICATLDDLKEQSKDGEDAEEAQPKSSRKRKSGHKEVANTKRPPPENPEGTDKTDTRKRKSKVTVDSSDEEPEAEEDEASQSEAPPPKKASARSQPPKTKPKQVRFNYLRNRASKITLFDKAAKPARLPRNRKVAIIETSDEDAAEEKPTHSRSPKKEQKSSKVSSSKRKQVPSSKFGSSTKAEVNEESDLEMSGHYEPGPSNSNSCSKPESPAKLPESPSSKKKAVSARDPMESELSSVIDEPPKKRQKRKEKKGPKPEKAKQVKKTKEALSKDDEAVNRLKSIVVACGVRKVWKKEFEGLDKSSQQIKRLHQILGELGMSPRYSVEKAKAIKERRELAQELSRMCRSLNKTTRRRDEKGTKGLSDTEGSGEQSSSESESARTEKEPSGSASNVGHPPHQNDFRNECGPTSSREADKATPQNLGASQVDGTDAQHANLQLREQIAQLQEQNEQLQEQNEQLRR
ncbi:hypothetical protein BU15DRAFT_73821 [Melanogaster broomeanus]|nr:hypothetical protein BU15DRAFT_73821 [Melanogaster broomeanus]